jgi:hypothetical protein
MLCFVPCIVEGDDPLDLAVQVRDDEADPRIQFAWMPFDLGDAAALSRQLSGKVAEAGVETTGMVR